MDFTFKTGKGRAEVIMHDPRGDVKIILNEFGVDIGIEGHNQKHSQDGEMNGVVFIGLDEELRYPVVLVWDDINIEDHTHRIVLRDSVESNRREGNGKTE